MKVLDTNSGRVFHAGVGWRSATPAELEAARRVQEVADWNADVDRKRAERAARRRRTGGVR